MSSTSVFHQEKFEDMQTCEEQVPVIGEGEVFLSTDERRST